MNHNKTHIEFLTLGLLIVAILWSIVASALTLQMYLPGFTTEGDELPYLDLMTEINYLASSLNYALPIAVFTMIFRMLINKKCEQSMDFVRVLAVIFFVSLLPVLLLMIHFDRLHGENINIWANHVWWILSNY